MKATDPLKQSRRRSEAELSFMLAGQALARWDFRLVELRQLSGVNSAEGRDLLMMEAGLGIQQLASPAERMQTFSRSRIDPIRFQAQELLVAVARIEEQLSQVLRQLNGQAPVRPAGEIAAALLGRVAAGLAAGTVDEKMLRRTPG